MKAGKAPKVVLNGVLGTSCRGTLWRGSIIDSEHISNSVVTIKNSTFIGNKVSKLGGIVFMKQGKLIIEGSNMTGNEAVNAGGAVYAEDCTVTITDSHFGKNEAKNGGALRLYKMTIPATITGTTFEANTATSGGAVYLQAGTIVMDDCILDTNTATHGNVVFCSASADVVEVKNTDIATSDVKTCKIKDPTVTGK